MLSTDPTFVITIPPAVIWFQAQVDGILRRQDFFARISLGFLVAYVDRFRDFHYPFYELIPSPPPAAAADARGGADTSGTADAGAPGTCRCGHLSSPLTYNQAIFTH